MRNINLKMLWVVLIAVVLGFSGLGLAQELNKININTASTAILKSLDEEIDDTVAKSISEYRDEEVFTKIEDLQKVSGIEETLFNRIKDRIGVKSTAFTIDMTVTYGDIVAKINALIKRDEKGSQLVYWRVR